MLALSVLTALAGHAAAGLVPGFRPPCVPLNVVSPYQSVWSCSDRLPDTWPQHWDGTTLGLLGALRVDGAAYRFMGNDSVVGPPANQRSVTVAPATTTYDFEAGGVTLQVRFVTPNIDLDADTVKASRPVTHVSFTVASADGKAHSVQVYYDNTAEGAVSSTEEAVHWSRPIATGASSRPLRLLPGHDVQPGHCDIANYVAKEDRCAELCEAEPRCVAFVTQASPLLCWLKSCGVPRDAKRAPGKQAFFPMGPHGKSSETLEVMQIGTATQRELAQGSDRINWGQWLVSTPKDCAGLHTAMTAAPVSRKSFASGTYFGLADDTTGPRAADDNWPVLSVAWDLGQLAPGDKQERHLTLAYDQVLSQRFFGTDMPPLWRKRWTEAVPMLEAVEADREEDLRAVEAFDRQLVASLTKRAGDKFATLASLVYRQVVGGTQAVHNPLTGEEWVFMKEISSDGDISTVDVVYPAFPMFQYLYPEYFRKLLVPLLVYGNNETKQYGMDMPYNYSWAPHHLGHWPVCDIAAKNQEQMPVEESGNMLIMFTALYNIQKNFSYLERYWPLVDSWADYIVASLPDPENQICTDDFEGPSPHNTNLAAKGIVALAAYADMVSARGDAAKAKAYRAHAAAFVANWTVAASDGDHYRIQFNLPNTWSLKYNLLYQKSLGLSTFPENIFKTESAYYQTKRQHCGVPLDNRHPYTKSDWSLWSAAFGSPAQLAAIVDGTYNFANETSSRVPLSDWYNVESCVSQGFRARPVQGGLFAPMVVKEAPEIIVA